MHTYATTEEILETYCALTPTQMASILSAAIRHMKGSSFTEPLDLIHQALVLMLDGRRNWPKHVEFGSFMFTIMRGIASDDRDCAANKLRSGFTFEDIADRGASFAPRTPSVEDQLL